MPTITAEWIEKHYNFLKGADCPVIACYGGAGSGKSYAICQELIERLFTRKGYVVLVIRKTGPSLFYTTNIFGNMAHVPVELGYNLAI
jgi:phage terminase large subunit